MSVVYIGSACIDEHGNAHGGTAGNQSGRELRKQAWYRHEKGWVIIRAKSSEVRAKIAEAMRGAVGNKLIGYDQYQRDTLYNVSRIVGFNPSKVSVKCETDCSALVRVCIMYAFAALGIRGGVPNFRTVNEPAILKATGYFDVLTDAKYTGSSSYLLEGDILCTPISGHTVVVLNDGDHAHAVSGTAPEQQKYTVTKGDSWIKIAKKFGFAKYQDLVALNGGKAIALQPGMVLRVK